MALRNDPKKDPTATTDGTTINIMPVISGEIR
jgi:hypothetical protein